MTDNPVGRPSKYQDAYCVEVVDFLAEGHSMAAFAGHIGVNPDTTAEWEKVHPEFSDAVKRGRAKAVLWWEKKLMVGKASGEVTAAIFGLKNRAASEWRDKVDHELRGAGHDGAHLMRWATETEKHD